MCRRRTPGCRGLHSRCEARAWLCSCMGKQGGELSRSPNARFRSRLKLSFAHCGLRGRLEGSESYCFVIVLYSDPMVYPSRSRYREMSREWREFQSLQHSTRCAGCSTRGPLRSGGAAGEQVLLHGGLSPPSKERLLPCTATHTKSSKGLAGSRSCQIVN